MSRLVLGINSVHADSSAVLLGEQGPIAAISEERITRQKHTGVFPREAIAEVLRIGGATVQDLTDVAVARDPRANLRAKLKFVAGRPRAGFRSALSRWAVHRDVRGTLDLIADALGAPRSKITASFHQVEHHLAHVASAFFWSSFERASGLSIDGAGDFASSLMARCEGNDIHVLKRTLWPHSAGVFYSALCQFIGFDRFGEEYKVMGLAAYGEDRFAKEMGSLIDYRTQGDGLQLALKYFGHHKGAPALDVGTDGEVQIARLWAEPMKSLFGSPRSREQELTQRERDIAASIQARFETIYLAMVGDAVRLGASSDVVMAGGCALNSVANGRMLNEGVATRAYFHPAASDDGTAAGAALYVLHAKHRVPRGAGVKHAYWGKEWDERAIEASILASGHPFKKLSRSELLETASAKLAAGEILGWFQGREEWGPRALGNRSILCHPGWPDMKATLNSRIKNREPFRPFAPAILAEKLSVCFEGTHEVPFMMAVYKVRPEWRDRLSAITHEDGTGRVQTVERDQNELYYDLIARFESRTGTPVLLNTSFNENEPLVHTPAQALDCYQRTRMDCLAIGPFWLEKPR